MELWDTIVSCQLIRNIAYSCAILVKYITFRRWDMYERLAINSFLWPDVCMLFSKNCCYDCFAAPLLQDVMIELYRRSVWNDAKTVNVIVTACFRNVTKVTLMPILVNIARSVRDD